MAIPSNIEVQRYVKMWQEDKKYQNYKDQENALDLLITKFNKNDKLEEILLKVALKDKFYSTNIFGIYAVARHIKELNIDSRLNEDFMKFYKLTCTLRELDIYLWLLGKEMFVNDR